MKKFVKNIWGDSLYRNSLYLIFNSFIMALFGFVFWTLAAQQFSSEQVGLATAVISAVSLVANISVLGFTVSILKFKNKSLNYTALVLCSVVSFFVSCTFLLGIHLFFPSLQFILSSWYYVLGFVCFSFLNVVYALTNSMLISEQKNSLVLLKDTLFSVMKVLLILFLSGLFGLLVSWFVGILVALIFSLFFVSLKRKWFDVNKVFHFSFYNYLSTLFALVPGLVLPMIVVHYLGASYAAYFYVSWMIAALLFIIPISLTQNLLSSGTEKNIRKAYIFSLALSFLGVLVVYLFGDMILRLFSMEYLQGLSLLYVLALSSIPYSVKRVYQTKLNLQGKVKQAMAMDAITLVVTLVGSVLFIEYGLFAIGLSWLLGNVSALVGVKR